MTSTATTEIQKLEQARLHAIATSGDIEAATRLRDQAILAKLAGK